MRNSILETFNTRGSIVLIALVFLGVAVTMGVAFTNYVTTVARSERHAVDNAAALSLAEAGIDRAVAQLNSSTTYTGETDVALPGGTFTLTVTTIDASTKKVVATGYVPNRNSPRAMRTVSATLSTNPYVISFHYGIQSGNGGFSLANSSSVTGNVFSSGSVIGSGNMIYGSVVSSGSNGLVYGIHATSTVYAHTLGSAGTPTTVDGDAYYITKINTTVGGTSHPSSTDQDDVTLPISDDQISRWESDAAAGGTISSCDSNGNYTISSSVTLGPKKIACNLIIKTTSGVLDVTGPIWVTGNITLQTGPTIKMDPSLGKLNAAIIADNPWDETGSGLISIGQNSVFEGTGSSGSYVFLISKNESAEEGGSNVAISMNQGATALVAYASHGLVTLGQSTNVRAVTAYKISLSQTADVTYDNGLPSTLFKGGPGGSWAFATGTYSIIR